MREVAARTSKEAGDGTTTAAARPVAGTEIAYSRRPSRNDTTLVLDPEKEGFEAIAGRVKQIRTQIEKTTSDYDREKLQERLANLVGGVAVIQVGGAASIAGLLLTSEATMTEIKVEKEEHRGAMPGGGMGGVY